MAFTLAHIVATAENGVIGTGGDLPWSIPEDMKFFRDKTKGHAMIMGRKTFESFPNQKPLPNRLNVVVTRQQNYSPAGVIVKHTLEEAISYCKSQPQYGEEIFIIGGGEIYKQSMSLVDTIYLTQIHQTFTGDTIYPEVNLKEFQQIEKRDRNEPVPFSFLVFKRMV